MTDPCASYLCLSPPSPSVVLNRYCSIDRTAQNRSEKTSEQRLKLKLTLWDSTKFTPIIIHQDLEPIMASMGFFPIIEGNVGASKKRTKNLLGGTKPVQWREYAFRSLTLVKGSVLGPDSRPRLKLPYPRVVGLHLLSYQDFMEDLKHYASPFLIADLLHIRPCPLTKIDNRYAPLLAPLKNVNPELELVADYSYRKNTLEAISKDMYLKNVRIKMCMRKDGLRYTEDERDDMSQFHLLG